MKAKKVACFVALPHHTRFMFPVMEKLKQQGKQVLFFTTASDYPFERDILKKGYACPLLQNYRSDKTRENTKKSIDEFFLQWTTDLFSWDGLRHWPFVQSSALITEGIGEYFCMEEFIAQEKPDLMMALHERNRWGKLLGHMARRFGIPYVTFQEGDYYEDRISFSAHTELSTALLLWGRDTQEKLAHLKSAPEKMVLTGNTHLSQVKADYFHSDAQEKTRQELKIPPGKPVVLFMVGLQWGVVKSPKLWEDLLNGLNDDVVKIFKWHPKVVYTSYKENVEDLFKRQFPECILVQNYDAYRLLAVADYCITLGKTTLAVEALCFGKPIFSLPGMDGSVDHYVQQGIAQDLSPLGNWAPLYDTIQHGVPAAIQEKSSQFLDRYFYLRNEQAINRGVEVVNTLLATQDYQYPTLNFEHRVTQRDCLSIIMPSGNDPDVLLLTILSLAEKVNYPHWEVIVVVQNPLIRESLQAVGGDIRLVDYNSGKSHQSLAALYNHGAQMAAGEALLFLLPGMIYENADHLFTALDNAVVGVPLYFPSMAPYCFGLRFDFNAVPRPIIKFGQIPEAIGGGWLAIHRTHFAALGGFDERLANYFIEADLSLRAKQSGLELKLLPTGRALCLRTVHDAEDVSEDNWQNRIQFFAKWQGSSPKAEDFVEHIQALLMN